MEDEELTGARVDLRILRDNIGIILCFPELISSASPLAL